ncbi:MAG: hypothetical protein ACE15B_05885 [Bryobacteraceae bacterium]
MGTKFGYLVALLLPALGLAQNWNAALYFGPGALISKYGNGPALYGGVAVERRVAGRFGIGLDVGGADTGKTNFNYSAAILSFGGSCHFLPAAARKLDPFAAIGVSGVTLEGAPALVYFGGGLNYWLKPRFGLRAEVRDHATSDNGTALHYLAARFGIVFRW